MSRRLIALLLSLTVAACGPGVSGDGTGVLVIAIDALRYDHLGAAGYDRATTPTLDRLATEGVFFEDAYTAAPQIIPAHVALLTGCDPNLARRPRLPGAPPTSLLAAWFVPDEVPRLARSLFAAGYATGAFVDHPWISPLYGFDRGFQEFEAFKAKSVRSERDVGVENVSLKFLHWVGKLGARENWFAYLTIGDLERVWRRDDPLFDRYFEPRSELGYVPPLGAGDSVHFATPRHRWSGGAQTLGESEAKYDGAVRRLDQGLGRLFERLRGMGRWERTTVVVVGSFGVSFGESGLLMSTGTFADVDTHVPLIVKPARGLPGATGSGSPGSPGSPGPQVSVGRRAPGIVSSIDILPTVLDLHGIDRPAGVHGVSQLELLRGTGPSARERAFLSWAVADGWAVIDERYCFEHRYPGSLGPGVFTSSWFGDDGHHGKELRLHLHDRSTDESLGHIGPTSRDHAVARELQRAGEEWFEWIERAVLAVHPVPWSKTPVSDEDLAELVRRGLIPD